MRKCTKCYLEKPDKEFYNTQAIRWCRECGVNYSKEYRERNRDKINKRNREKPRKKDPEKAYFYSIKTAYGLNEKDYLELKNNQNNKCFICGKNPTPCKNSPGRLSVDHNHSTGQIRSLICRNCNAVIGHCFEDISILQKIIDYLNLFQNKITKFNIPIEKLNRLTFRDIKAKKNI